MTFKIKIKR